MHQVDFTPVAEEEASVERQEEEAEALTSTPARGYRQMDKLRVVESKVLPSPGVAAMQQTGADCEFELDCDLPIKFHITVEGRPSTAALDPSRASTEAPIKFSVSAPQSSVVGILLTRSIMEYKSVRQREGGATDEDCAMFGLFDENTGTWLQFSRVLQSYQYEPSQEYHLTMRAGGADMRSSPEELLCVVQMALKDDRRGRQPVHVIVCDPEHSLKNVQILSRKRLLDLDGADGDGVTALMYAAGSHSYECAAWILQQVREGGELSRMLPVL